jgi:hypothetical protein
MQLDQEVEEHRLDEEQSEHRHQTTQLDQEVEERHLDGAQWVHCHLQLLVEERCRLTLEQEPNQVARTHRSQWRQTRRMTSAWLHGPPNSLPTAVVSEAEVVLEARSRHQHLEGCW